MIPLKEEVKFAVTLTCLEKNVHITLYQSVCFQLQRLPYYGNSVIGSLSILRAILSSFKLGWKLKIDCFRVMPHMMVCLPFYKGVAGGGILGNMALA